MTKKVYPVITNSKELTEQNYKHVGTYEAYVTEKMVKHLWERKYSYKIQEVNGAPFLYKLVTIYI